MGAKLLICVALLAAVHSGEPARLLGLGWAHCPLLPSQVVIERSISLAWLAPLPAAAGVHGRHLHQAGSSCPNTVWSLINSSPDLSTLKEAVEAAGLKGEC